MLSVTSQKQQQMHRSKQISIQNPAQTSGASDDPTTYNSTTTTNNSTHLTCNPTTLSTPLKNGINNSRKFTIIIWILDISSICIEVDKNNYLVVKIHNHLVVIKTFIIWMKN